MGVGVDLWVHPRFGLESVAGSPSRQGIHLLYQGIIIMYPNPKDMTPKEQYEQIARQIHYDRMVRRTGLILVALATVASIATVVKYLIKGL